MSKLQYIDQLVILLICCIFTGWQGSHSTRRCRASFVRVSSPGFIFLLNLSHSQNVSTSKQDHGSSNPSNLPINIILIPHIFLASALQSQSMRSKKANIPNSIIWVIFLPNLWLFTLLLPSWWEGGVWGSGQQWSRSHCHLAEGQCTARRQAGRQAQGGERSCTERRYTFIWTKTVFSLGLLTSFCEAYVSLASDPMPVSF